MILSREYFCYNHYYKCMIHKLLLLFFIGISLFSCKNNDTVTSNLTWIGGEIVNPKNDFIVFYKGDQVIDSVKLDVNNHFIYKVENLKEGLYSFRHKEFQVFYLKPLDSLMLRVNTIEFDESLSFTGKGANRNNFLMDMFLLNEAEINLMPKLYKLPPLDFEKALDSLKQIRKESYQEFESKNPSDNTFKEIANASINYDYYSKKEIYITANERKKNTPKYIEIPEEFYAYRNDIDFGSETLRSYFPYYRFLFRYFDNIALTNTKSPNYFYYRSSIEHNTSKIQLIDSIITNDSLKNNMIKNITARYLLNCNEKKNQKKILALFLSTNTNKNYQKEIIELAEASLKITTGNKIPNLSLLTTEQKTISIQSLIKQPTVFYFWSSNSLKNYKNLHYKVKQLQDKFPEYSFIGINTDANYVNWKNIVNNTGYDSNKEYQFKNLLEAEKQLVIYALNKAIIVDKKGVIIDGSSNLYKSTIEKTLLGYLNK